MKNTVDLSQYDNKGFTRGRSPLVEFIWLLVQATLIRSWIPGSWHRCWLLRIFGANIGNGVNIKPGVKVKFPWQLSIGDHSWIGEDVWIDNLGSVEIGRHCCISQGAYLCTGSHGWDRPEFPLIVNSIVIGDSAWVAARAIIAPGVKVGKGAVLALGGIATSDLEPWTIYAGSPAKEVHERTVIDTRRG